MKILFVNASPNREHGNTAAIAEKLLAGKKYETLNLSDYKIYAYGQNYEDDQFEDVVQKIMKANVVVMGSPLYWHNINGLMRNFLDRCYGPVEQDAFKGKDLYFIIQGASPQKWQFEACEFTMSRFAGLYGFDYKGMVTNKREAEKISF